MRNIQKTENTKRDMLHPRLQRGSGFVDFILALAVVALLAYVFVWEPQERASSLARERATPPRITIEKQRLVDTYAQKPAPTITPRGGFSGELPVGASLLPVTFFFSEKNRVAVEMTIPQKLLRSEIRFAGSATYHFDGSVLVFDDVSGDKALFSEQGLPIELLSPNELVIVNTDSRVKLLALN